MAKTETELSEELLELEKSKVEAEGVVAHVRELLEAADMRRRSEDERRWNRVLNDLEDALDVTKARLTVFKQEIRDRQRQLKELRETGATTASVSPASGLTSEEEMLLDGSLPEERVRAAEKMLAIPLADLGKLTLEDVAAMDIGLAASAEEDTEVQAQEPEPNGRGPRPAGLAARIEQAKQKRQALAAARRPSPSFQERRKQKTLRDAVAKIGRGAIKSMTLEEIELLTGFYHTVAERADANENDVRLKEMLEPVVKELDDQAHELRRKRARSRMRKQY